MKIRMRALGPEDAAWIGELTTAQFGRETVRVKGEVLRPAECSGFVACNGDERLGVVTFRRQAEGFQVVSVHSLRSGMGIGTALVNAVLMEAKTAGCARVTAIVSHENERAMRFFRRLGFHVIKVHPGFTGRKPEGHSGRTSAIARVSPDDIEVEVRI